MPAASMKEPSKLRTKYIMVRVTREEHRNIKHFARERKQTIADMVREAITTLIKKGVSAK